MEYQLDLPDYLQSSFTKPEDMSVSEIVIFRGHAASHIRDLRTRSSHVSALLPTSVFCFQSMLLLNDISITWITEIQGWKLWSEIRRLGGFGIDSGLSVIKLASLLRLYLCLSEVGPFYDILPRSWPHIYETKHSRIINETMAIVSLISHRVCVVVGGKFHWSATQSQSCGRAVDAHADIRTNNGLNPGP